MQTKIEIKQQSQSPRTNRFAWLALSVAALLGLVAPANATLNVVNGDFSDLTGLTGGPEWYGGIPSGWTSTGTPGCCEVNVTVGNPAPAANLDIGNLKQNVGTNTYNSVVTLTFDIGTFNSAPSVTVRITDGTNIYASTNCTTGNSQTLTASTRGGSPVYIEYIRNAGGSPSLDNVSVSAVAGGPVLLNGDFSDLTGMTNQGGGWYSGVPAGWTSTSGDTSFSVNDSLGTTPPVCNVSQLGTLKQNVGTFSNNTTVTLTFDVPQAFPNAGNLTARITDGTNVFAVGSFSAPSTNQTLATYVPAATPIYIEFVTTSLTPGLDNVAVLVASAPLTLVNGDFSDLSGLIPNISGWFDGVPVHWSSTIASPAFTVRDPSGTNPVANPSTLGFLVQKVGVITNTSDVILTFDNNTAFSGSSSLGAAILDGALAPLKFGNFPTGLGQTLVATNVPAGTIIHVEFWQVGGTLPGLDNVSLLLSATGSPTLSIQKSGTNVTVSWSTAFNGWVLESSIGLSPASWGNVSGVTNNSVAVPASSGNAFFRLRRTY